MFKVGDRVRWNEGGNVGMPVVVTALTERGFRWRLEAPTEHGYVEGECQYPQAYELLAPVRAGVTGLAGGTRSSDEDVGAGFIR
jgi:hypothetical protein